MPEHTLDILLVALLLWLGWRVVADADVYRATLIYIVFGLLVALAWVRLDGPDIALAEAAIAAGLVGVLLLGAIGQLGRRARVSEVETQAEQGGAGGGGEGA